MVDYYTCPDCGYDKAEYVEKEGQIVCFKCGHRWKEGEDKEKVELKGKTAEELLKEGYVI